MTGQSCPFKPGSNEYKNLIKYVSGSQDGTVKIWLGPNLRWQAEIKVSNYWVTTMAFMTASKRLAVATSDRTISFYEFANVTKKNTKVISRIEGLIGMPLCLEYYEWPEIPGKTKVKDPEAAKEKVETLLMGDDLGFIHKYDMYKVDWHYCFYKDFA